MQHLTYHIRHQYFFIFYWNPINLFIIVESILLESNIRSKNGYHHPIRRSHPHRCLEASG